MGLWYHLGPHKGSNAHHTLHEILIFSGVRKLECRKETLKQGLQHRLQFCYCKSCLIAFLPPTAISWSP